MEPRLTNPFQSGGAFHEPAAPADEGIAPVVPLHAQQTAQPQPEATAPAGKQLAVRPAPGRAGELVRGWYGTALETSRAALSGNTVFREQLPSLAGLWREMAEADWVPEDAKLLRFLGRAYRLLLVLPASLVSYTALWLLQRPLRLFLAAAVSAIAAVFIFIFN
ncbi:hypothetical protein [Nonomuraea endophytica]|uniref:hypothetical protein n=1 Tax=Nonomuraea endophytica TaxID=714136 RepID=UPI0037C58F2E